MDEQAARFELLKLELTELQQGVRAADTILFQVKGLAVTVALGTAGIAITADRPHAALLGALSSVAFSLIDGHRKQVQGRFIRRSLEIEGALAAGPICDVLVPGSSLGVPGIARHLTARHSSRRQVILAVAGQALRLQTSTLYVALLVFSLLVVLFGGR